MKAHLFCWVTLLGVVSISGTSRAQPIAPGTLAVSSISHAGDFLVANRQGAAPLYFDSNDFPVVEIATNLLAGDIKSVTKSEPTVSNGVPVASASAIFIGTLGKSRLIDGLVAAKKLDVKGLEGAWESYVIATVANPLPGVKQGW